MRRILLLGAGRSAFVLIKKLSENAVINNWLVDIVDINIQELKERFGDGKNLKFLSQQLNNYTLVQHYNVVISMLPPSQHFEVAKSCVEFGKHLLTASYKTPEIQLLHEEAKKKKALILMECGLDPGLDHITAMQIIDKIKSQGGEITSFRSYCGGLMSDKSDVGNPWKYKITWNPRNVVLAGQGGLIKYLENGQIKCLNYHRLFQNVQDFEIENAKYEGYPNRDSLKYIELYGLNTAETFIRGTLRKQGFCEAWNLLVLIGLTDDTTTIENLSGCTYNQFFNAFLPSSVKDPILETIRDNKVISQKIEFLGLFSNRKMGFEKATPAMILQKLIEKKLKLNEEDTDLVVMQHAIKYKVNDKKFKITSSLVCEGKRAPETAMAATVGLPLYYALELILNTEPEEYGVCLPINKWIYEPILKKIANEGIVFKERTEAF